LLLVGRVLASFLMEQFPSGLSAATKAIALAKELAKKRSRDREAANLLAESNWPQLPANYKPLEVKRCIMDGRSSRQFMCSGSRGRPSAMAPLWHEHVVICR
jgi:hypothetical protein